MSWIRVGHHRGPPTCTVAEEGDLEGEVVPGKLESGRRFGRE